MRILLLYCAISLLIPALHAQEESDVSAIGREKDPKHKLISDPHLDLSLGPVYGMHPNLRNIYPKGYYFIEGKGSATVLGLPFRLSFRQSNELLRFGRASYFKLSFDPQSYGKQQSKHILGEIERLDGEISSRQQLLYALEAKLSYLYQKKAEYDAKHKLQAPAYDSLDLNGLPYNRLRIPDTSGLRVPDYSMPDLNAGKLNVPDLDGNLKKPDVSVPKISAQPYDLSKLDSISGQIASAQKALEGLKGQKLKLQGDYSKLTSQIPADLVGGIRKLDLGQTTLGKSSMSGNAVPVNGVHVKYAGERYFTDLAAGYTFPNQLFSNQVFDQVIYNSGNVFNLGNFFQENNVRFVSSAFAGYGKENGNHIAVENFYSGLPLKQTTGSTASRSFTSNLTTRYSPSGWKNLTWRNTVGVTWTTRTDLSGSQQQVKASERISLYSNALVNFPRLKSSAEVSYRRIPSAYDGFTQGIYLSQTTRTEFVYRQILSRNLRASLKFSRDLFFLQNTLKSRRLIHQAVADAQLKLGSHFTMTGSYSVLQLEERAVVVSPRSDISHLGRLGLTSTHEIAKHRFTTLHDVSYASIRGLDSIQILLQANAKYAIEFEKLRFGMQLQYSDFSGLKRLYGKNMVVQPEVGLKLDNFSLSLSYQQLWSEQFEHGYGMIFRTAFAFSEHVDFDFVLQRFLPTEYALFIDPELDYKKPLYVKLGLNVRL